MFASFLPKGIAMSRTRQREPRRKRAGCEPGHLKKGPEPRRSPAPPIAAIAVRRLDRQPGALRGVPVAPGTATGSMTFVQYFEDHFLSDRPRRDSPALAARPGVDNFRPLQDRAPTAFALHRDALGAPPIDLAEVPYFLDCVVTGNAFYNPHL